MEPSAFAIPDAVRAPGYPGRGSRPATTSADLSKDRGPVSRSWNASFAASPARVTGQRPTPAPYLRREFTVGSGLRSATLHVTALGLVEAYLNGSRVGAHVGPGEHHWEYDIPTPTRPAYTLDTPLKVLFRDAATWAALHSALRQHLPQFGDADSGTEPSPPNLRTLLAYFPEQAPAMERDLLAVLAAPTATH